MFDGFHINSINANLTPPPPPLTGCSISHKLHLLYLFRDLSVSGVVKGCSGRITCISRPLGTTWAGEEPGEKQEELREQKRWGCRQKLQKLNTDEHKSPITGVIGSSTDPKPLPALQTANNGKLDLHVSVQLSDYFRGQTWSNVDSTFLLSSRHQSGLVGLSAAKCGVFRVNLINRFGWTKTVQDCEAGFS